MTLYTQKDKNIRKTWFLMALFLVIIVAFLLICMAVLSIYFGFKVWFIRNKVAKFMRILK